MVTFDNITDTCGQKWSQLTKNVHSRVVCAGVGPLLAAAAVVAERADAREVVALVAAAPVGRQRGGGRAL